MAAGSPLKRGDGGWSGNKPTWAILTGFPSSCLYKKAVMLRNNSFVHSVISEFQGTIWFKEMRQRNTAVRSTFKIRHGHGDKKKQDI